MDPSKQIDVVDWWINKAFTYGLGFVFTSVVLGLILWVVVVLIGIMRHWLPLWFASTINMQHEITTSVKELSDTVRCTHAHTHANHEGLRNSVRAARSYARANKQRLGIKSDVLIHLDNAADALENVEFNHSHDDRIEEEEDEPVRTHTTQPPTVST